MLKQFSLKTNKQFELIDITEEIKIFIKDNKIQDGAVLVFNPHTTAAIRINHFEPLLSQDIMRELYKLAPVGANYNHDIFEMRDNVSVNERSNGHSHIKAFLLGSSEVIPVSSGNLILGDRQSVLFVELDGPRQRDYYLKILA